MTSEGISDDLLVITKTIAKFRRLVIARSKKNRERDISQKVFELVKLNNEFENCLNPASANKFVILNRYELKFLHSANTG